MSYNHQSLSLKSKTFRRSIMENKIIMYGTTWCPDCTRAKSFFSARGIEYDWINIDEDHSAAEFVIHLNSGKRIVPTIIFPVYFRMARYWLSHRTLSWRRRWKYLSQPTKFKEP